MSNFLVTIFLHLLLKRSAEIVLIKVLGLSEFQFIRSVILLMINKIG